jgi:hypothetical protein
MQTIYFQTLQSLVMILCHTHKGSLCICLQKRVSMVREEEEFSAYHWSDIGMWYGIELVKFKLVVGAYIDVCPFIFRTVAIFRSGKD